MKNYILYNPLSANGKNADMLKALEEKIGEHELKSVLDLDDKIGFLKSLDATDRIYLIGGDGTINKFANGIKGYTLVNEVYYCAGGTGNDFITDEKAKSKDGLILLNPYLKHLPTLYVNDEELLFINGVGYGLDGYCCSLGLEQAKKSPKPVNYTAIAIKLLLFKYKRRNAKITVDGVTKTYKRVWLAPTMLGRFYGGGMMVTPNQMRDSGKVSCGIMYGSGKLKTLMVFPSIFKGEHVLHKEMFEVLEGKDILVEFDRPTDLQVDGEVFYNVTKYRVKA